MVLSPLPFLFALAGMDTGLYSVWRLFFASLSAITCMGCAFTLLRRPSFGKLLGAVCSSGAFIAVFPYIANNPFAALFAIVALMLIAFALMELRIHPDFQIKRNPVQSSVQRARWSASIVPVIIILYILLEIPETPLTVSILFASFFIGQILFAHWAVKEKLKYHLLLPIAGFAASAWLFYSSTTRLIPGLALSISLLSLILLPHLRALSNRQENVWELLLYHPARILFTTFIGLSVLGTVLLLFPVSTTKGTIDLVDAAFTSVSAVCVTGLIVLDTPTDFTFSGQFFILLLIQLGGLGIMSITTVSLHAMGRRLSLKQERLLVSMTHTDHKDLLHSLSTILRVTFLAESIGALFLTFLFYVRGDTLLQAAWHGLFTAISAFCNAGFALQSDSLISCQHHWLLLHVVAMLIIFGGMAPAISRVVPKWVMGKTIPVSDRIALVTTVVLLFSGIFFVLAFEWNGILKELSFPDKIQNAWFQSVTLRTAGFNSVDMRTLASPTFVVMLCFMFIGGSPGGTAGGIKTTTIGILAMTFWTNITNGNDIIIQNRRVPSSTIHRAITIVVSGMIIWFIIVLMLEVTQQISARDIIFEATSAIGTVGLSVGATPLLDEIGKIIIMIAMFVGRIGPMTLFMLLSRNPSASALQYPDAKISLT